MALVPVGFAVAFAVGEVLYALFGADPGDAPIAVEVFVTACVLATCLVPCIAAVTYGGRARRAGMRSGGVAAAIGFLAGTGWVVLTLITEIGDLVRR